MQSKKIIESQFIVKITDIMKEHPDLLKWTDNGAELYLTDIDLFCQKVLPQYFRHKNFNSFIRQLNIYSFNKTKKVANSIWFKHDIFKRGNDSNFFLVQRKRKFKELENYQERFQKQCEDLIQEVEDKDQITDKAKEVIVNLLEYKFVSHVNLKRMKCELEALHNDLKDLRNKKINELSKEIKSELLSSIHQLITESKKIDELISKNFLKAKQTSRKKQVRDPVKNDLIYGLHIDHPYVMDQADTRSRSATKEQPQEYYVTDEIKDNFKSYNSFHVFLEEFKTRKEQFTYENKLYNPFHSQNSFMFLPNYVTAPSHLPYDGRYNVQYQSIINENEEKNAAFDNFDDSASISFVDVKDFEQQDEEMLVQGN